MIKLLIADDHSVVREGLKHVVAACADIQVIGEAEDAAHLFEGVEQLRPDVALVDVTMPGPGIIEVIRHVKSLPRTVRVLVLSMHPEKYYAERVLSAGADGYLTKNHSARLLPSAIRRVYEGRKYITPSVAEELANNLTRGGRPVHEVLSNREYEVFLRIGAGKSAEAIAQELGLSAKTVRTYRARIVEKTHLNSTAELIFYAVKRGLVGELSSSVGSVDRGGDVQVRTRHGAAKTPKRGD